MKWNLLFLGLSAFFSVVCITTPDAEIGSQIYAQGNTTISSNSTNATIAIKNDRINLQVEELLVSKSPTSVADVAGKIRNNNSW